VSAATTVARTARSALRGTRLFTAVSLSAALSIGLLPPVGPAQAVLKHRRSQILGDILNKRKQSARWIVAGCLAGSLLLPLSVPAYAEGEDALESVSRIAPEVLSNTAPAHETEVTNQKLRVRTGSADADIPLDSSNQVRIADSGTEIKIGLPFSEKNVKGVGN
jgi:hypothetical protein